MLPDPCAECGFDGRSLKAPDLVAVLGSLPRRWAEILDGTASNDDEDGDNGKAGEIGERGADRAELIHVRPPGGDSAAELAARSAAEIGAAADRLGADRPGADRPGTPAGDDVSSAARRLGAVVGRWRAEDWSRPDAIDAVRRAAHAGVHNLGPAAEAVQFARSQRPT